MQPGIVVFLLLAAVPDAQVGQAPLRLAMEKCGDLDTTVVNRVVTMELGASLQDDGGVVTTARVECRASEVAVTIDDPVTGKNTTRVLDFKGQPRDARSRLLGLAISEAVLASWIELEIVLEPAVPPTAAAAPPAARRQAIAIAEKRVPLQARRNRVERSEVTSGPVLRWFGSGLVMQGWAAGAVRWLQAYPYAGVALDLDGGYGQRSVANVAQASAMNLSLAPRLLMRASFGRFCAIAGAGWRVALARLASEPVDTLRAGRTVLAGWTGPFLGLDLSVSLWRSLFLRVGVESGRVLIPARGSVGGVRAIAFDGSWLAGELSLGTSW